jgi:hypothetical protein
MYLTHNYSSHEGGPPVVKITSTSTCPILWDVSAIMIWFLYPNEFDMPNYAH